ncbi:fimbrial protein [Lelliottia sp. SL45]|uniref:fimbrial protein n=1 Tax=Lelliottia sp. SL45 TaxID=2994665 RepID=UPI0022761197|nr:fimbrial protein [Lelliottia sp. SL45]MCY1700969.1 fimbrial protein [Lelliottia sp. SL45]
MIINRSETTLSRVYTAIAGNFMHKHTLHAIVLSALYSINVLAGNIANIYFSGKVVSPSCTISTGSVDQTINLGSIDISDIRKNNNTGMTTPVIFTINVEKCAGFSNGVVTFTGDALTGEAGTIGIVGTAKGASVVLYDADGSRLNTGTASKPVELVPGVPEGQVGGITVFTFSAGLVGQGPQFPPQAGSFTATSVFSIDYF